MTLVGIHGTYERGGNHFRMSSKGTSWVPSGAPARCHRAVIASQTVQCRHWALPTDRGHGEAESVVPTATAVQKGDPIQCVRRGLRWSLSLFRLSAPLLLRILSRGKSPSSKKENNSTSMLSTLLAPCLYNDSCTMARRVTLAPQSYSALQPITK
jgi:hypothetical protein